MPIAKCYANAHPTVEEAQPKYELLMDTRGSKSQPEGLIYIGLLLGHEKAQKQDQVLQQTLTLAPASKESVLSMQQV